MSARVFKVKNRLASVVALPGGRTVAEALRSADTRIESIRERCVSSLDGQIARLGALAEQGPADPKATLDGLYRISNEIFSVAGAFGLKPLCDAAYGLCDLIDIFRTETEPNWTAVDVHVGAMRLLSTAKGQEAEMIVEGLTKVRARYVAKA